MVLKKFNITYGNYSITKPGNIKAFSLVEMLMALLVASLLLAALAPVMTKKLNENVDVSLSGNTQIIEPCAFVNDTLDTPSDRECVVPKDATIASAIIVSGGGGGGGAQSSVDDPNVHISGVYRGGENGSTRNSSTRYDNVLNITKDMSDIEIEMVSGGSGGGVGNTNGGGYPGSQADCGDWGIYIAPEYNGENGHGTCVSKYNPGEGRAGSPSIPSSVELRDAGKTYSTSISNYSACWRGNNNSSYNTASLITGTIPYENTDLTGDTRSVKACNNTNGGYSGCYRTVCQANAAKDVCSAWKPFGTSGRLPDISEARGWSDNLSEISNGLGTNGLQLCSYYAANNNIPSNIAVCAGTYYNCYGATDRHGCGTSSVYITSGDTYGTLSVNYGRGGVNESLHWGYAKSVRCVADQHSVFRSYIGAGGTSGQYIKFKVPNVVLSRAFKERYNSERNEYIEDPVDILALGFDVGFGGRPGTLSAIPINGGIGSAVIKRNSENVFYISLYGAGGATSDNPSNATSSADGQALQLGTSIRYLNQYSEISEYRKDSGTRTMEIPRNDGVEVVAHEIGTRGNITTSGTTSPGASGASYWNGMYRARTASDTPETAQPGSGGIGGYCTQGSTRNDPVCTPPTSGSAGAARFTYKRSYPGIGGNGGNSGSVLHIKNLLVREGDIIKVHIGAPGSGGMANYDGQPGGNSYIEINGKRYEVVGGKGGKTGIAANPNAANESDKFAKQGSIQEISETDIITSQTKTNLNSLDNKNYEIFPNPSNNDEKLLAQGKQAALNPNNTTIYKAGGGNGGMNIKTSPLAGLRGIPCGSFSNTTIKIGAKEYKCGDKELPTSDNYNPNPLYRTLSESDLKIKVSNYINSYAPGATAGAGAGWSNDYKTGNTPKTGQGQDGMGGYVLIYFR